MLIGNTLGNTNGANVSLNSPCGRSAIQRVFPFGQLNLIAAQASSRKRPRNRIVWWRHLRHMRHLCHLRHPCHSRYPRHFNHLRHQRHPHHRVSGIGELSSPLPVALGGIS